MKPTNTLTDLKQDTLCEWLSQLKPYKQQETFLEFLTNHYALMVMNPATIDHARHMTRLLKSDFPTLAILIVERLKELRNDASSDIHS